MDYNSAFFFKAEFAHTAWVKLEGVTQRGTKKEYEVYGFHLYEVAEKVKFLGSKKFDGDLQGLAVEREVRSQGWV